MIGQLGFGVVGPFDVGPTEPGELDAQPGRRQPGHDVTVESRDAVQRRLESDLVLGESGVDHLRGQRALPHQVVDGELVTAELGLRLVE